ncbi:response regulator transcription factor [Paenibacillus sp.]|uniref:response regulator transcription factor n=1 Tax=Paenibacillus sp. TaxID=58172 RepID=UPI002810B96B|nr:response regulator transcription factor [Paenibacillus sp.]
MEKVTVMIVEDQEIIRKSLGIVLNLQPDLEVVALAANGEEAVSLAARFDPSVILMDVRMPVMDGVRATELIKKAQPNAKVIMLTTFQDTEVVSDALQAGAEGYILKAIDPIDLASAIRLVSRGETMISREVAKALFARSLAAPTASKQSEYGLTERETQVLTCISHGLSNRDIAEKLFLSEGTVKNYISSIYSKLNVHNRASALRKASEEKLL